MSLEDLTVRTDKVGGKYSHQVVFEINTDEVRYFTEEDTAAARTAWAKMLLQDMKRNWPNEQVYASLDWVFSSFTYEVSRDCRYVSNTLRDDGWVHMYSYATALYIAEIGDNISCTN